MGGGRAKLYLCPPEKISGGKCPLLSHPKLRHTGTVYGIKVSTDQAKFCWHLFAECWQQICRIHVVKSVALLNQNNSRASTSVCREVQELGLK